MVLARASLGLSPSPTIPLYSCAHQFPLITQLQSLTQIILGLQNDILGWEKDHLACNPLNAIAVLIRDGYDATAAFEQVLLAHNDLVGRLTKLAGQMKRDVGDWRELGQYGRVLSGFGNAMAEWMLCSGRYQV